MARNIPNIPKLTKRRQAGCEVGRLMACHHHIPPVVNLGMNGIFPIGIPFFIPSQNATLTNSRQARPSRLPSAGRLDMRRRADPAGWTAFHRVPVTIRFHRPAHRGDNAARSRAVERATASLFPPRHGEALFQAKNDDHKRRHQRDNKRENCRRLAMRLGSHWSLA